MQDLPKEVIQTARGIASHPEDFLSDTTVFTTAWAALKAERGQSAGRALTPAGCGRSISWTARPQRQSRSIKPSIVFLRGSAT